MALAIIGPAMGQWTAVEEAKLTASDAADMDQFGGSTDFDGDTAVVGAIGADLGGQLVDAGAAYVFVRGGTGWNQQAKLQAVNPAASDSFGAAVAVNDDTVVVGSPNHDASGAAESGAVFVFQRTGTTWSAAIKLQPSDADPGDRFGSAVAVEGDTILVGAPGDDNVNGLDTGAAYIFMRAGTTWSEQAKLLGTQDTWPGDAFGTAVALDGDRAAIGAPYAVGGGAGSFDGEVLVFVLSGGSWIMEDVLHTRPPAATGAIPDEYGRSVAISGDTVLGGVPWDTLYQAFGYAQVGSVHVHERNGSKWSWSTGLTKKVPLGNEGFGRSVSLDGNLGVIGAPGIVEEYFQGSGLALVFTKSGSKWKEVEKLKASDAEDRDVVVDGHTVAVGAENDDHSGLTNAGSVYVYRLSSPGPKVYCTAGVSSSGCTATLTASGAPSATAPSGFVLNAQGVEGSRVGIFVYGTGGKQAMPWGNGTSYRCTVPPISSGGPMPVAGTLGSCDGTYSLDLNALWCPTCPKAHTNPGESAGVQTQLWYRDPMSTGNQPTSFSDAIEFWVAP